MEFKKWNVDLGTGFNGHNISLGIGNYVEMSQDRSVGIAIG
jgi:hypothetical protein